MFSNEFFNVVMCSEIVDQTPKCFHGRSARFLPKEIDFCPSLRLGYEVQPKSITSILLLIQTHAHSVMSTLLRAVRLGSRHRNLLTTKAWEKAVQELGKNCPLNHAELSVHSGALVDGYLRVQRKGSLVWVE